MQAMRIIHKEKITRSHGYLSRFNPENVKRDQAKDARFVFSSLPLLNYWYELPATEKHTHTSSMLHLQSEQSCVTEMQKQEGAPFLSLAAGGAPRFIQMLLTQPKPKVMVSFTRRHLRTQHIVDSPNSPDSPDLLMSWWKLTSLFLEHCSCNLFVGLKLNS